ncbi:MAG: hypothetical protein QW175_06245 [Candidatus Bathyarchaeia archaeon]
MAEVESVSAPKNLICNFRAPTLDDWLEWRDYVQLVKDQGLDVCRVTLSLAKAFKEGVKNGQKSVQIQGNQQVINISMTNHFNYVVQKPRREPYDLSCVKPEFRKTFSSLLYEAYILNKARELNRPFCFRDFLELKPDAFRRIIRRLKRKGKILSFPQRTCPRFYFLAETLNGEQQNARQTQ